MGHGVARVRRQVHEHLLDLAGLHPGRGEIGRELHGELDPLADELAQQVGPRSDDRVEVHRAQAQDLLAAERQELLRQGRGPVRSALDLGHFLVEDAVLFELIE